MTIDFPGDVAGKACAQRVAAVERGLKHFLAHFSAPTSSGPVGVAQEVVSAISMCLPLACGYYVVQNAPEDACQFCGEAVVLGMALHLPFSVAYHIAEAAKSSGRIEDATVPRCLDQSFVHICCLINTWAIGRSFTYFLLLGIPLNLYSIAALWLYAHSEPRHYRFLRMGFAVFFYLLPLLLWRGQQLTWFISGSLFLMCGALFALDSVMAGWGHCLMHLSLVPFLYTVVSSALV
eukprot:CAMPEP_0206540078 /NCGR_PEP_ID=MMETSP0325_2-20121206/8784_1 /ASSEMBLY_ACC=CAM_ASM_000347 /TAXON_ID=2866 /ORGANISM="Crypthecodinium cohnii, Strain Seligo" /LENGTH=234 /DNA_ID=CAMNT_0054037719 /DNA_START=227 /DNA_END=931 /DNA_ORIENTATION=+